MNAPTTRPTAAEQAAHRAKQPPLMDFLANGIDRVTIEGECANIRKGLAICAQMDREAGE